MKSRNALLFVTALAVGWWSATPASSQVVEPGRFNIDVGAGIIRHANASALKSISPNLNLRARYAFSENFGVGISLDYTRTETDSDIFPRGQFDFGTADSTLFVTVKQPVAVFQYQVIGSLGTALSGGSLYPRFQAGIGAYSLYLDPQQNEGPIRQTELLLSFGGAMTFNISGSSSVEISAHDYIWTSYDRDLLHPIFDRTCRESGERQFRGTVCPNERFPFIDPEFTESDFPDPSDTIHNLVFTASFSFSPDL